jgi:hypothetical protein
VSLEAVPAAPGVMQMYSSTAKALVRGQDVPVRDGQVAFTVPGGSYFSVTGVP